jgi:hypothetical protein
MISRTLKHFILFFSLVIGTIEINAQSNNDYVRSILDHDSLTFSNYARENGLEIVLVTNSLSHDSLITIWHGFPIRYIEADSLEDYIYGVQEHRLIIEVNKIALKKDYIYLHYYAYIGSKKNKKSKLLLGVISSSSIKIDYP